MTIVLRFWKGRAIKDIEKDNSLLEIRKKDAHIPPDAPYYNGVRIPKIHFEIEVLKKQYGVLKPQKLLVNLYCDDLLQKTYAWFRGCNIDNVKVFDLDAIGNGSFSIDHMCLSPHYGKWEMKGSISFRHKVGDISKDINLTFPLSDKQEKELMEKIMKFQQALRNEVMDR